MWAAIRIRTKSTARLTKFQMPGSVLLKSCVYIGIFLLRIDNGYPHDGRADKDPYPHDRRADKDSYPHDSNNQCIILRLQLSFAMINVQLMLV